MTYTVKSEDDCELDSRLQSNVDQSNPHSHAQDFGRGQADGADEPCHRPRYSSPQTPQLGSTGVAQIASLMALVGLGRCASTFSNLRK